MSRKICVVTGTRAEYGLLRWLMEEIKAAPGLHLQVIATGMHLSPEFGLTYREIEADGFTIDRKVEMLTSSDTPVGIAKSMGLGTIGFADALADLAPDILVVLGDRFEIFAAVAAALVARIPVAHLHGGERTEGAVDEALRHAITKMAHLHFVATEEYRKRVIQLGEQPDRVFLVGGLGVDAIKKQTLLDRPALEESLGFRFGRRTLLVTYHPATLTFSSPVDEMNEVLAALDDLDETSLIFTMPNADAGGRDLISLVERFVAERPGTRKAFTSLGLLRYLSCLAQVDAVVGNSSSGLLEAPSFGIGTINIGDRQRGRLCATSVISCTPNRNAIAGALERLYSPEFQEGLKAVVNPYGEGGAGAKIVSVLTDFPQDFLMEKAFYDLPMSQN
ncbi:UDP-N-acetylglucosamine 2-epimerase [Magnetospirillum fulvum]|uniref:UDP-N-acetylglucosamine 2-epimerase n=1 Tax=Magnetospirillum fulvum MGU-K5 TaxID=1316936 RepID=S9SCC1_MAGFU|nr:UDP-N-acetylglucosamine 2-epimerase [Magnetospirillum fulvum]EPY01728.1 UDP-N-acetylglucosamine 2-epimerase [Magnetospirillum fulvum MGU-K5]